MKKWREQKNADKILLILRIIASAFAIVMAILQLTGIWKEALNVAIPMLGAVILFQSIQEWKEKRGVAVLGFCTSAFIFACSFAVWFIK